jgi:mono/diheme cytochrome c family protein
MNMSSRSRALLGGVVIASAAIVYFQAERPSAAVSDGVVRGQAFGPLATSGLARVIAARVSSPQALQSRGAAAAPVFDRALLDKYCVTCHNERRKASAAGLALDQIDTASIGDNARVWEKVVSKLRGREMPPAGVPRPDAPTYRAAVTALETALDRAASARPNPGRIAVHRLNRTEYSNAIRDLLALDVDPQTLLRPDETGYGFDNIADVLTISPGLMEDYKLAAWKISRLAIGDPTIRPSVTNYKVSRFLDQEYRVSEDLPFGSRGGTVIQHTFPLDGEYSLRIELQRAYAQNVIKGLQEREEIDVRMNGEPVKLFAIGGECVGSKEPRCVAFQPKLNALQGVRVLPAEYDLFADKDLEVRFPAKAGPATITVAFLDKSATVAEGGGVSRRPLTESPADAGGGLMAMENVAIEGPFNGTVPTDTASRRRIFTCHPTGRQDETACARRILSTLARRAYRRPVTAAEVDALLAFYEKGQEKRGFESGIQTALEALLMTPNFLLRVTQDPASAGPGATYPVDPFDLASRLSFFLWSSIPDDQLLDLAASGKLKDPKVLEQQVRRMLADSRSKALVDGFFTLWLSLRDLQNVAPDPALFPDFDDNLRQAFLEETKLFVESQFREDHAVSELLTADYTFLNERLAQFYGVPHVYGARFRRVTLTDPNRMGLLGHGSVLTVTSYSTRTSPVVRGKWLLTNILGSPPPAPPPDVPALVEAGEGGAPPSTVRERMSAHRNSAVCASCHRRIDPMGFALENFSAIGRWRTTEYGLPVDASGAFPDGTEFRNPAEFRKALATQSDEFVKTLTTKLLTYALGRGVEYYDMPAVRSIMRETAAHNHRWSALVLGIVKSTPFQMNRTAQPESPQRQVASGR